MTDNLTASTPDNRSPNGRVLIVIPARLRSTRLAEKPLVLLDGKPLVQHAYEIATRVPGVDRVIVAADDECIVQAVRAFGGDVMLTSTGHATGTDRLAEVARTLKAEVYVNLQCDEPLARPADIATLIEGISSDSAVECATLYHRISAAEAQAPTAVKVVVGAKGEALFFSRAPIPYARHSQHVTYCKHVGIYAYRACLLARFGALVQPMEERSESLEQLRLLHAGVGIKAYEVDPTGPGVDTAEDLEIVRRIMAGEGHPAREHSLANVRLVITDIDGVLTDGGLYYDANGEAIKRFHVRDGLAVHLLRDAGIRVAAVSGRASVAAAHRLRELGFDAVHLAVKDKRAVCNDLLQTFGVSAQQTAFIGDDLQDLPAFEVCAHRFAPCDGDARVRAQATVVLATRGGSGVLREAAELVLAAIRQ